MRIKIRIVLVLLSSLILLAVVYAQGAETETKPAEPIPIPASELKWTDLDPAGAPGVKVADLWGDHKSGAFGAIFKLPAGFSVPLHKHTHDMKLVIVSGTYIQGPEGKPEFRLGPGSYLMQPGGNYLHTTSCNQDSDCIFFVESNGAFDLQPAVAKNAAAPK